MKNDMKEVAKYKQEYEMVIKKAQQRSASASHGGGGSANNDRMSPALSMDGFIQPPLKRKKTLVNF